MLNSSVKSLVPVVLPYAGRQHYMHEIDIANPVMLEGFEDYHEPVITLLRSAGLRRSRPAFMTVDEKVVKAGMSQRRPGPHVDGRFMKDVTRWGHGPGWNHSCNLVPLDRMSIITAASIAGCVVYEGQFDAEPRNDGDLTHIRSILGAGRLLSANRGHLLSPDCVHESIVYGEDTERTFLRIAF